MSVAPSAPASAQTAGGDGQPMDELSTHAATIADILERASERVERLAAEEADAPTLVEAMRQELSLSRRWNRHLGTMLSDVVEARRALGERERAAAKEIARLTAVAEEARLELMALRRVLQGNKTETKAASGDDAWLEGSRDIGPMGDIGNQIASSQATSERLIDVDDAGKADTLEEAQAALDSMQELQKSAARDVDAVRGKIIQALRTLVAVRGDLPLPDQLENAALSSEDITAWAASMAIKLEKPVRMETRPSGGAFAKP